MIMMRRYVMHTDIIWPVVDAHSLAGCTLIEHCTQHIILRYPNRLKMPRMTILPRIIQLSPNRSLTLQ